MVFPVSPLNAKLYNELFSKELDMPNATPPTAKPVTPATAKPVPPPVAAKPATPPAASPGVKPPTARTDGPTLKQFTDAGYEAKHYPPAGYAANPPGTTPPEPAGAERFRAVSYPNNLPATGANSVGTQVTTSIASLDARLTELEAVVHAIAPYSRNAAHPGVTSWVSKVGSRLKSLVGGK